MLIERILNKLLPYALTAWCVGTIAKTATDVKDRVCNLAFGTPAPESK